MFENIITKSVIAQKQRAEEMADYKLAKQQASDKALSFVDFAYNHVQKLNGLKCELRYFDSDYADSIVRTIKVKKRKWFIDIEFIGIFLPYCSLLIYYNTYDKKYVIEGTNDVARNIFAHPDRLVAESEGSSEILQKLEDVLATRTIRLFR